MVIQQGDVYWADLGPPTGSAPGFRHPVAVVQNDAVNQSAIGTVIVCLLTSNVRLAHAPGNVLLERGEAHLPKRSVVNVSQILTLDKDELGRKIGTVSNARVEEIITGIAKLLTPTW